jgi:outer membrane receptor protein involved in Fe transport
VGHESIALERARGRRRRPHGRLFERSLRHVYTHRRRYVDSEGCLWSGERYCGSGALLPGRARKRRGQWAQLLQSLRRPLGRRRTVRARGSAYRAFRVPTLNELYRQFSAGNATTLANPALRPETLFGAEFGGDFVGERSRARLTFYRNDIRDIVTNVTIAVSGNQITRQRQNAARVLSRGLEFDASSRWRNFRGEIGYLFVDSRFSTRERVPQIPKHQGSAQLSYDRRGFLASAGVRTFAAQFEDDRNLFVLPGFATLQLVARQRLTSRLAAIAAFENLLDRQILTAISPVPAIGAPRLWRIGLRWEGKL